MALISQTTSKEIEKKNLLRSNCPLLMSLADLEHWRIMSSNQIKGDLKLATLQKSLVKAVVRALIFAEVQKERLKYKQLHKWLQILLQL